MRTLRIIEMALLAVCVSFASCSSDDEDENNGGGGFTNSKKLISISKDSDDESATTNFIYGEDGKLIHTAYVVDEDFERYVTIDYTWNYNTITAIYKKGNGYETNYTIRLQDGKISTSNNHGHIMQAVTTYSENYLKGITGYYAEKYTWENGNITKLNDYDCTYYSDKINKHCTIEVFDLFLGRAATGLDDLVMAHPDLVGISNKNLLKSRKNSRIATTYSYELDKDGYPTKISVTDTYTEDGHSTITTIVYTLNWN